MHDTAKRSYNVTSAWTSTSGVPQPKPRQPTLRFSHRLMTDGAGSRRKVSPADLKGTPNILHYTSQQIRYLIPQRLNHTSQQPICHGAMLTRVNRKGAVNHDLRRHRPPSVTKIHAVASGSDLQIHDVKCKFQMMRRT